MTYISTAEDLVLHGVRVMGFPAAARIARRYGLDVTGTSESLLDFEARGWVSQLAFAGATGWTLTDAGRVESARRSAAEVESAGAAETLTRVHHTFLPLNKRLGTACTDWQIRPARADPLAFNDHADWRWDERVLAELASLSVALGGLCEELASSLYRLGCYPGPFSSAVTQAKAGRHSWVDAPDRDSCQAVWIQFHEDLLATLGLERGPGV